MFEKEAEDSWQSKDLWYKVNADESAYKTGFQDGYNKANEWHYVKDGEYPTHSNRVLVFTYEGVGFGIYGLNYKGNKKWYLYDIDSEVIAWKEIVSPREVNINECVRK